MIQEGLKGHFVPLTTPCEICWRKSGLESCWSPEFTESVLRRAFAISSGRTLRVILLHRFPPPAVSVPVDQHRGAQPTKNTFSRESVCLGKNATEIPR